MPERIKNYNSIQLRKYLGELNGFMSRNVQYHPDAHGRPIPGQLWNEYKRLERRVNKNITADYDAAAPVKINAHETVAERRAKITPKHKGARQGTATNLPQIHFRSSQQMASAKAVETLIKQYNKMTAKDFTEKQRKTHMDQFLAMAKETRMDKVMNAVKGLSPRQFDILWNYTDFATKVSIPYLGRQALLADKEKPWHVEILENAMEGALDLVEYAKTYDVGGRLRNDDKRK